MLHLKNKVCNVGYTVVSIVAPQIVFFGGGLFFLLFPLSNEGFEPDVKRFLMIFGICSIAVGIFFTVATLWLLSVYPRHKRLMYLFLQSHCFLTDEEIARRERVTHTERQNRKDNNAK